jgi:hypothetical protein
MKEMREAQNNLKAGLGTVKKRRKENERKLREKILLKNELNRKIDKFDESLIDDHKHDLEQAGKLKKLEL